MSSLILGVIHSLSFVILLDVVCDGGKGLVMLFSELTCKNIEYLDEAQQEEKTSKGFKSVQASIKI